MAPPLFMAGDQDPLALHPEWSCAVPLTPLQQAMEGRTDLFPVLLSGIWRERLSRSARDRMAHPALRCDGARLSTAHGDALARYRNALETLPLDLSHHGHSCAGALRRLHACQPSNSPFRLVQQFAPITSPP